MGQDPAATFADDDATARLIDRTPTPSGFRTERTPAFLRWRYGFEPLHYRVLTAGAPGAEGAVVFRLRHRGDRVDLTVCDELGDPRAARRAIGTAAAQAGAHLVLRNQTAWFRQGFVRLPGRGQTVTWRSVDGRPVPTPADLAVTQGDLELF